MIELLPTVLEVPQLDVVVLRAELETGIIRAMCVPISMLSQFPTTYDQEIARRQFFERHIWYKVSYQPGFVIPA